MICLMYPDLYLDCCWGIFPTCAVLLFLGHVLLGVGAVRKLLGSGVEVDAGLQPSTQEEGAVAHVGELQR